MIDDIVSKYIRDSQNSERLESLRPFYENVQKRLLSEREMLKNLTKNPKDKGDYYEYVLRSFLRDCLSTRYGIYHGCIFKKENLYQEYDIVIVDENYCHPLYKSRDFIVVDPNDVRVVIQVKGYCDIGHFRSAVKNLKSAKEANKHILTILFVYQNALESKHLEELEEVIKSGDISLMYIIDDKSPFEASVKDLICHNIRVKFPEDYPLIGKLLEFIKLTALNPFFGNFRMGKEPIA